MPTRKTAKSPAPLTRPIPPVTTSAKHKPPAHATNTPPPTHGKDAEGLFPVETPPPARQESTSIPDHEMRATAHTMATKQREISVSEFFAKNRHLLGFDNPSKALLTTVKEAVDNSLDACEEAGIPPEVRVTIRQKAEDRFVVAIEDNGPGIVKAQIPKIFGKLLYGSKFHHLKMSRGQQGIGISAAALYGQLTTGKPITITSKTGQNKPAHFFRIHIDTAKNNPEVLEDREIEWKPVRGTHVELEIEARYSKGHHSVEEYLRQVAMANPHVTIHFQAPDGDSVTYERSTQTMPPETKAIRPHPYGVELGVLMKMLKDSKARNVASFFSGEFSRVSPRIAGEILQKAAVSQKARPAAVSPSDAEKIHKAIAQTRIMAPPTNCIWPIGEELLLSSLKRVVSTAEYYVATTRSPSVYRGNPFLVEAAVAFGGTLSADEPIELCRFANRVPLLYAQSGCAITEAVKETNWRPYGLSQPKAALPVGPAVLMVHIASVWVPFTSESKEAVAAYDEIEKEIRLAIQECGRKMATFIRQRQNAAYEAKRRSIFELYAGILAESLHHLTDENAEKLRNNLSKIAAKFTGGELTEDEAAALSREKPGKPAKKSKKKPLDEDE